MKTMIAVTFVAVMLSGCAGTLAKTHEGRQMWCVPTDAKDRGPFQPVPAKGEKLTVQGYAQPAQVAQTK